MTGAIEVNDAGLVVATEQTGGDAETRPPSPGYAIVDGGTITVGRAAHERARLTPRLSVDRFWSELSREPLASGPARDLSHADLAHAHLQDVWASAAPVAILAVPGSLTTEQLALLIGVARAAGVPAMGLVDAAIAGAVTVVDDAVQDGDRILHLDLELHRAVLTEALVDGRSLVRRRVDQTDQVGLALLADTWAKEVAGECVRQTRFDPLHTAAAEQRLHLALPDLLATLQSSETTSYATDDGAEAPTVQLTRSRLLQAVAPAYRRLGELAELRREAGRRDHLLLTARVAALPGFGAHLDHGARPPLRLEVGAAARGAIAHATAIHRPDDALPLITRLQLPTDRPARPAVVVSMAAAPEPSARPPTHLLHGSRAVPIAARPLDLGTAVESTGGISLAGVDGSTAGISRRHCQLARRGARVVVSDRSSYGTFVNGSRIDGEAELSTGDRLRLGTPGIELLLIAVDDA